MNAFVFPGQGSQFVGMGKDLYHSSTIAKNLFEEANSILGFAITDIMFSGTDEELKQTRVTQPAIFIYSVILSKVMGDRFKPDMVAGHSLGELSAITAAGGLSFKDGLQLVSIRAEAMQKACIQNPSTMAAILGLDDSIVEKVCSEIDDIVVPANYNSPGQLVISGSNSGIEKAIVKLTEAGAKRALKLQVSGAFHSPLMEPARNEFEKAVAGTVFSKPACPVYQNVNAQAETDPEKIKVNLIAQLTSPVLWTQTIRNMITHGATTFTETGPGNVLQGLIKKIDKNAVTNSATI